MQTYYQCYWNKTSEENIRILRMFGESEEAVVPEMIAGRAVVEAGDTGRWGGLEHTPCGT